MLIILILFIFLNSAVFCHEVNYRIDQNNSYIVEIYYADGTKFSYESYEIYRPGEEEKPFQVGRTDEKGRVCFLPDREGKWKIKAFTEDGHGINVFIDVKEGLNISVKKIGFFERFSKPVFGVGVLLIIFSLLNIYVRRRR